MNVTETYNKSQEEIEYFNLILSIFNDNHILGKKIEKALKYLKEYEVTFDKLDDLKTGQ